jgi:hypothetical protein
MKKKITMFLAIMTIFLGIGKASALTGIEEMNASINITGNNSDKLDVTVYADTNDVMNQAIERFYSQNPSSKATVVPFGVTVKGGQTWTNDSDLATLSINVPKEFNTDRKDGIYLLRITQNLEGVVSYRAYSITEQGGFTLANFVPADNIVGTMSIDLNNLETTGTTYFVLITCHAVDVPDVPETPENPETLDMETTSYIVIGAICLVAIIGLGSKFALANKK